MKRVFLVSVSIFIALLVAGCDPFTDVTFDNQTRAQLMFYTQDDSGIALDGHEPVSAGSQGKYDKIRANYRWLRIAASTENGQWIFDQTYTRDELEGVNRKVVVSSLEPVPPPVDVRVYPYQTAPRRVQSPAR